MVRPYRKKCAIPYTAIFRLCILVLCITAAIAGCSEAGVKIRDNDSDDESGSPLDPDDPDAPPKAVRPVAFFYVNPNPAHLPVTIYEEIIFNAAGSKDETGHGPIVEYWWDFAYRPDGSFFPRRRTQTYETLYSFTRYREGGQVVALVVVNAAGIRSDIFYRTLAIQDREGVTVVVE